MIEHPRACGARPAMLAPSALAAGAARMQQALRVCSCLQYLFFFFLPLGPKICKKITILALFRAAEKRRRRRISKCSNFVNFDPSCTKKSCPKLSSAGQLPYYCPIGFCLPDPPEAKFTFLTFGKSAKRYARTIPNTKSLLENSNRFHFENKIEKAQGYLTRRFHFRKE